MVLALTPHTSALASQRTYAVDPVSQIATGGTANEIRCACVLDSVMVSSSQLLGAQVGAEDIGMVPVTTSKAYVRFGQGNDKLAQSAGLEICVRASEGSIANIHRMVNTETARSALCRGTSRDFLVDRPIPRCDTSPHVLR